MTDLPTTIQNERVKLRATYLNGGAIALVAIGSFAPLVSYLSGSGSVTSVTALIVIFLTCLAASAGINLLATNHLGRLKQ